MHREELARRPTAAPEIARSMKASLLINRAAGGPEGATARFRNSPRGDPDDSRLAAGSTNHGTLKYGFEEKNRGEKDIRIAGLRVTRDDDRYWLAEG